MAKSKLDLHGYQQDILSRLKAATTGGTDNSGSRLGVRVGDAYWLISLADVNEVLPVPSILSVPLTKTWFLGVANIRGVLYGINDFSAIQGHGHTSLSRDSRVLTVHQRFDVNIAILVNQLVGLRNPTEMKVLDDVLDKPVWQGKRYQDAADIEWNELMLDVLLDDQAFMQIAV